MAKKAFVADVDGRKISISVIHPTEEISKQAAHVSKQAFDAARAEGIRTDAETAVYIRESGLWNDAKEKRDAELRESIEKGRQGLLSDRVSKAAKRFIAASVREQHTQLLLLRAEITPHFQICAETVAVQAAFDFHVAACTIDAGIGQRYFRDMADYAAKLKDGDPVAKSASKAIGEMVFHFKYDSDSLPEDRYQA